MMRLHLALHLFLPSDFPVLRSPLPHSPCVTSVPPHCTLPRPADRSCRMAHLGLSHKHGPAVVDERGAVRCRVCGQYIGRFQPAEEDTKAEKDTPKGTGLTLLMHSNTATANYLLSKYVKIPTFRDNLETLETAGEGYLIVKYYGDDSAQEHPNNESFYVKTMDDARKQLAGWTKFVVYSWFEVFGKKQARAGAFVSNVGREGQDELEIKHGGIVSFKYQNGIGKLAATMLIDTGSTITFFFVRESDTAFKAYYRGILNDHIAKAQARHRLEEKPTEDEDAAVEQALASACLPLSFVGATLSLFPSSTTVYVGSDLVLEDAYICEMPLDEKGKDLYTYDGVLGMDAIKGCTMTYTPLSFSLARVR